VKFIGGSIIKPRPALAERLERCSLMYGKIIAAPFIWPNSSSFRGDLPNFSNTPTVFIEAETSVRPLKD